MVRTIVDDPEKVETKRVNKDGSLYLGNDYAGREVTFILVGVVSDEDAPDVGDATLDVRESTPVEERDTKQSEPSGGTGHSREWRERDTGKQQNGGDS